MATKNELLQELGSGAAYGFLDNLAKAVGQHIYPCDLLEDEKYSIEMTLKGNDFHLAIKHEDASEPIAEQSFNSRENWDLFMTIDRATPSD